MAGKMTDRCLIWGTSGLAEQILANNLASHVTGFLDSNRAKWGTSFQGLPLLEPGPEVIAGHDILIASIYFYDIYRSILAHGGKPEHISIASEDRILSPAESAALVEQHRKHILWLNELQQTQLKGVRNFGPDRRGHLRHAAEAAAIDGLVLEFGVFKGASLQILADECEQQVYGFDTFTGLPADWTLFHKRNFFDLGGELPLEGRNITLVKGLFEDTLEPFLANTPGPIRLLHCDADLYSSTEYVLKRCADRLIPGSVIIFDDYLYMLDYERCDYRAAMEFLSHSNMEADFLSQQVGGSVALRLRSLDQ